MGSRWNGRLALAAQAALDTSHELGRQARAYGENLIGSSGQTGPMVAINEDLLSGYVGKRNQRRIMEIAAKPGDVDKVALRRLGLTHDATHGLADARQRGELPSAGDGEAADQWWQANEAKITQAAALNQEARTVLWNMAAQTVGSMAIGVAAMAGANVQPRPAEPPREPRIGLPRLGGRS